MAGRLLGSESDSTALEACCSYVFEALLLPGHMESRSEMTPTIESQLFNKIKGKFGSSVEKKDFSAAIQVVDRLTSVFLSLRGAKDRSALFSDGDEDLFPEFGLDLPFNYTTFDPLPAPSLAASFFQMFSSSPFAAASVSLPLPSLAAQPATSAKAAASSSSAASATPSNKGAAASSFSADWLREQCAKQFDGASVEDMRAAIHDLLTSGKDDDALQNDLFELLGFERFDFIQSLLENRGNVIALGSAELEAFSERDSSSPAPKSVKASSHGRGKGDSGVRSQPSIAGQVSILSESEKKLIKAIRKEEKK